MNGSKYYAKCRIIANFQAGLSADPNWVPDPQDRDLTYHSIVRFVTPVMLRRGISCVSMEDLFRVMHYCFIERQEPLTRLHKFPTEKYLRKVVSEAREEYMASISQLDFDGKSSICLASTIRRLLVLITFVT